MIIAAPSDGREKWKKPPSSIMTLSSKFRLTYAGSQQCRASTLTLSTKPLIRSSYCETCWAFARRPCLRTSADDTSISSSCSLSALEIDCAFCELQCFTKGDGSSLTSEGVTWVRSIW